MNNEDLTLSRYYLACEESGMVTAVVVSIFGKDASVESLIGFVRGFKDVEEIPKRQRYVGKQSLSEIFVTQTRG